MFEILMQKYIYVYMKKKKILFFYYFLTIFRSSLRKPKSPRHSPSEKSAATSTENTEKSSIEIMRKNSAMGSGFKRATAGREGSGFKTAASGHEGSFVREKNGRENSFVREKSNLSYKSSRDAT